jgi:hypothetical protein
VSFIRRMPIRGCYLAGVFLTFLIVSEVVSRVDDWALTGEDLFSSPSYESNLRTIDGGLIRGKPHGRYKKWKLNAFGFRGSEMNPEPMFGVPRIMILGSSETFGLYESEGKEFPAQLEAILNKKGKYEVVNAAVAGMSLKTCIRYWDEWAVRFRPTIVILYFNPLFYLRSTPPGLPAVEPRTKEAQAWGSFESRFLSRMKDRITLPDWLQELREELELARLRAGKDPGWYFPSVPKDRLDMFREDLSQLLDSIGRQSAVPILVSHAMRAKSLDDSIDWRDLRAQLVYRPRANEALTLDFELQANQMIREIGQRHGIAVVDAATHLSGRRECFADLVHLSDRGAEVLASLIADEVTSITLWPAASVQPSMARR